MDTAELDASVLLCADLGLLASTDPRFRSTCDIIGRELMRNGRIMRYTADDDFGAPETAFLACSFWYIGALCLIGRKDDARQMFEDVLGAPQCIRAPVRGHSPGDRRALGQFPASVFNGGDHQHGDPSVVELGGSMGPRLIIVSNRVAVPEPGSKQMAGGLVVAVKAALRNRTGVWFGWSGKIDETETAEPRIVERNHITYAVIDLSKNDFEEYYNGLANRVLWPILHYRVDLQEYSRADHSGYMRVNRQFADKLSAFLREDDVVWVHDYHLMPLARELRARGHLNPIGFFLHIPCAPLDILRTLPHHDEILGALTYYDLVGFQTENDRDNFAAYLLTMPGAKKGRGLTFEVDGRQTRIGAFPVSIETATYARLARNAARSRIRQGD